MGSWGREDVQQGSVPPGQSGDCLMGQSHIHLVDKPGGATGNRDGPQNPGLQHGKLKTQKPLV